MKKLLTLSAAAFALVAGAKGQDYENNGKLQQHNAGGNCPNKCEEILKFEKAAAQARKGRKIHLVDLDDQRQLREYEDDGLCINIGDLVIVAGLEDKANGQDWKEYGILLDQSILQVTADDLVKVTTPPLGFDEELFILTGMASGQTVFQVEQTGPCQKAKRVDIAVFVNPDRCPRRERKHYAQEQDANESEDNNENDNQEDRNGNRTKKGSYQE